MAKSPAAPSTPRLESSTHSSLIISWLPPLNNGGSVVTGYELWMDSHFGGGDWERVYDGRGQPDKLFASISSPTVLSGKQYLFKVRSQNQYGLGDFSPISQFTAREPIAPPLSPTALKRDSDSTGATNFDPKFATIVIQWSDPIDNGGSPLTNYEISMDNGKGGNFNKPGKLSLERQLLTVDDSKGVGVLTIFYKGASVDIDFSGGCAGVSGGDVATRLSAISPLGYVDVSRTGSGNTFSYSITFFGSVGDVAMLILDTPENGLFAEISESSKGFGTPEVRSLQVSCTTLGCTLTGSFSIYFQDKSVNVPVGSTASSLKSLLEDTFGGEFEVMSPSVNIWIIAFLDTYVGEIEPFYIDSSSVVASVGPIVSVLTTP